MHSFEMYTCVVAFGALSQCSGCLCTNLKMADKAAASSAVQVNIVGSDGSAGPPLFISPNNCGRHKNGANPAVPMVISAQTHNVSQLKYILWVYIASCI